MYGLFIVNDMQTTPPLFLEVTKLGFWSKKDEQWSETYEKTIFQFLFFWDMVDFLLKFLENSNRFFVNLIQER